MFSGKTEELLRRLIRAEIAKKKIILMKYDLDNRYGDKVSSHLGRAREAIEIHSPKHIWANGQFFDVIGVDEIQFLGADNDMTTPAESITWLVDKGKTVIVTGLDTNFRREPFHACFSELLAIADEVTKLKAICVKCGDEANLTQRLTDGKPSSFSEPAFKIGGLDTYEARCRECFEIG